MSDEFTIPATTLEIFNYGNRFPVRRIYCVGRNYRDHIREMGEADERDPPFFFQKPTDAVVPDGGVLQYPLKTHDFQYEAELVVAIGKAGHNIAVEKSLSYIFGYAVGLDMTRRDRQFEARERSWPWEMGKSFDQSAPCGVIHRVADIGHVVDADLSLTVNGKPRQHNNTAAMIWNVEEIISNLSHDYMLAPGDLIYTGTPAGVGPVVAGDVIEAAVTGLTSLKVSIEQ